MSIFQRIRWGRVSLAGAVVLGTGLWLSDGEPADADAGARDDTPSPGQALLVNRLWIDHIPRSERDMTTQLLFLDQDGERIGGVIRASHWRHLMEMFRWEHRSGGLALEFPQVGRTIPVNAQARECKDAPKPLDLCLDVSFLGQRARLFSKKGWKTEDMADVDALLAALIDPDAVDPSPDDEPLFATLQEQLQPLP